MFLCHFSNVFFVGVLLFVVSLHCQYDGSKLNVDYLNLRTMITNVNVNADWNDNQPRLSYSWRKDSQINTILCKDLDEAFYKYREAIRLGAYYVNLNCFPRGVEL